MLRRAATTAWTAGTAAAVVAARQSRPRIASAVDVGRLAHHLPRRNFSSESVSFTFIDADGGSVAVTAEPGKTLLDVAQENDVELEGACGGELACSTCHLVFEKELFDKLPEISEEEEDMLDLAWGLTDTSRLGCQIKVTKDLEGTTIRVPDESNNLM
ncbi:hypothetical protein PybrP1_006858 [[Pythium] brassicae (nom. inval.)]|nr:hypothetical protein PybrP1_006858 [[Pythium] brassicae (nom. inval.)]